MGPNVSNVASDGQKTKMHAMGSLISEHPPWTDSSCLPRVPYVSMCPSAGKLQPNVCESEKKGDAGGLETRVCASGGAQQTAG